MSGTTQLPVLNLHSATYECTFGRGCDGICCREGRPLIYPEEIAKLTENVERFLPLLRPEARSVVVKRGFATHRRRLGQRLLRVADGWCVFFNTGCVLHRLGVEEGDKFRYKPAVCALFPLQQNEHDQWYVRQQGFEDEKWDLFCLDPKNSLVPAADALRDELTLAKRFDDEARAGQVDGAVEICGDSPGDA
ncbi:MAG TPA: DUF3109 family protein [Pirellulales bacterium]|nr:DUF3109 family protein [Pirellulales bacterium]